jgi:hypothetical protein
VVLVRMVDGFVWFGWSVPSSFVRVADCQNHRVQVLRLVVGADRNIAHLQW